MKWLQPCRHTSSRNTAPIRNVPRRRARRPTRSSSCGRLASAWVKDCGPSRRPASPSRTGSHCATRDAGSARLLGGNVIQAVRVPGGEGRAAMVQAGQSFRVVDVDGGQVGDLFAFTAADPGEFASAEHTRVAIAKLFPQPGDPVLTNRRRPILVAAQDTSPGRHDMLYAACDPARYALLGATAPHRSCAENLRSALH